MRNAFTLFVALLFAPLDAEAAAVPPLDAQGRPNRHQSGPWDNDVLVFRVGPDGMVERLAAFERAGVPTVARLKDGRLIAAHQHFPENSDADFDKVAVHLSSDEGRHWTAPQVIRVQGLPQGMRFPFDPTLVPLPDGRVRLYFTGNMARAVQPGAPAIHSAISMDGVDYTYEPGVRFSVAGRMVIDCAVVLHRGVFHLYAPDNGVQPDPGQPPGNQTAADRPREGIGYHATSQDGLSFRRLQDVRIDGRRRWLGNAQSDGREITFFGTGDPGPGGMPGAGRPGGGIWVGVSPDGQAYRLVSAPPIPIADPGAVAGLGGGWIIAGTGPPRRATPLLPDGNRPGPLPPDSPKRQPGHGTPPGQSGGLQSHQVCSATSADGLHWTRDKGVRLAGASVPCAINDGDRRVLLYFVKPPNQPDRPETVACAVSTDAMKFDLAPEFRIDGLPSLKAVDPSIVRDGDGKFRLYYLASNQRGDPARGPNPHAIHLALSDDGTQFRESGPVFSHDDLVDPDVFQFQDRWFMYVFAGRATVIATSADGREFNFVREMKPRDWGTTAPALLPDGRLRLYAFEQRVPLGNAVRSFVSTNGLDWTIESAERLRARADEQITDPFVIPWRGGWKMYFKASPARDGLPQPRPVERNRPFEQRNGLNERE